MRNAYSSWVWCTESTVDCQIFLTRQWYYFWFQFQSDMVHMARKKKSFKKLLIYGKNADKFTPSTVRVVAKFNYNYQQFFITHLLLWNVAASIAPLNTEQNTECNACFPTNRCVVKIDWERDATSNTRFPMVPTSRCAVYIRNTTSVT